MADQAKAEADFREDLRSVLAVADALTPFAEKTADLIEVCNLALENDAQLRLLMAQLIKKR